MVATGIDMRFLLALLITVMAHRAVVTTLPVVREKDVHLQMPCVHRHGGRH